MNITYLDSEEDLESVKGEVSEQANFEEAPLSPEFPDLDIPEASASKGNKSSSKGLDNFPPRRWAKNSVHRTIAGNGHKYSLM